jgi:murein DD-endopeptidase MepM/ murein hydrolase activator NlpD
LSGGPPFGQFVTGAIDLLPFVSFMNEPPLDIGGGRGVGPRTSIRSAMTVLVAISTVMNVTASAIASVDAGRGPAEVSGGADPAGTETRPASVFSGCPVDRPHHYVDDFGDARWVGGFHRHQGIDVFAPAGTPIRAPFDGRAQRSDSWAGGIAVYVYGRPGFVYNAHLSRPGRLGKVHAGDVVGYVGNTGDAQGGSAHDHFEWHPKDGPAVDPFHLLNAVCLEPPPPVSRATQKLA